MRIAFLLFAFQAFALALSAQAVPVCKEITIAGPAGITERGGSMILRVKSDVPLPANTKFEWKVSAGTIVSGQGTESIEVIAPPDGSVELVRASVEIAGLQAPCDEIVSEGYGISAPATCGLGDDWGKLRRNDERVRLYANGLLLSNNPGHVLVFILFLAPNESLAKAKQRADFIRGFFITDKLIKGGNLHVPPDRLHIVFARADDSRTSAYVLPPDDLASFVKSFEATLRPEDLRSAENPKR